MAGQTTAWSRRWTSCRCLAHPDSSPRPSPTELTRGIPAAKQKGAPSPELSQPVPLPVGNSGQLSPEPVCKVLLLLPDPFIKRMWFVLNEGKMPHKQPTCGRVLRPRGRLYVVALVLRPGWCVVMHQLHLPVLLTIMVLEEISQKLRPCLKTTVGFSQTGARGLYSRRNPHPERAKQADKPKRPKRRVGPEVPTAIPVASWLCLAGGQPGFLIPG